MFNVHLLLGSELTAVQALFHLFLQKPFEGGIL